jgi:hypothetical protein
VVNFTLRLLYPREITTVPAEEEPTVGLDVFEKTNPEIFSLLGFYAAYNGSFVPTFREKLSVPS